MQLPKPIRDNLRFLCVEVDSQLARLVQHIAAPSTNRARQILDRAGYPDNLKQRIHASCLERLAKCSEGCAETPILRGVELIATELNRITGLCRDCIEQMQAMDEPKLLDPDAYTPMLRRVRRGIDLVEPAIHDKDTRVALKIAQLEDKLDRDYHELRKQTIAALKQGKRTEDLIRALFVAHDIEQMGDALLGISESIISTNLGRLVDLDRYHSLAASVEQLDADEDMRELQVEPIAETRSGSAIAGISTGDGGDDYVAIFKDGEKRKLKEERAGVESWHEIYPGLAPRILSYKKRGRSAALLIEHLPGFTFEQILLQEPPAMLAESLARLSKTLRSVWRETRLEKPICADFTGQLSGRLDEVYKVHPEFRQGDGRVCGVEVPSFDSLVAGAHACEKMLRAPFSVYIHGDFNVDNIIYDPEERRINFIDLHRSRYMDYVQDVSVFMVSNYRLQILDRPLRNRIMQLAQDFCRIARRYAAKNDDATFELRLALGLARSFATSTRFILDKSLARDMFLRARYLLELVLSTDPRKARDFKLPIEEIFVA
jgi:phosphate uptake regulator/aminoglycoside phosphotransferase (APT) family kinase protein